MPKALLATAMPPARRKRLLATGWVIAAVYGLALLAMHFVSQADARAGNGPRVTDFDAFYAAAVLTDRMPPSAVYEQTSSATVLRETVQRVYGELSPAQLERVPKLRWYYPPSFLLLVQWLDALPPVASQIVWTALTGALFLVAMARMLPWRFAVPLGLAFPATFMCSFFGQNGFLTAGLLGMGLLLLPQRPWAAGMVLGLVSFKPQFLILVGVALLVTRGWRAILGVMLTTALLAGASVAAFGVSVWTTFFTQGTGFARQAMENGTAPWTVMPTAFAAVRMLGLGRGVAYVTHTVVAVANVGAVAWAWNKRGADDLAKALVLVGVLQTTPFGYVYDMPMLALALAWHVRSILETDWLPGERLAVAAAFAVPFAAPAMANAFHLQAGPLLLGAWSVALCRRIAHSPAMDPIAAA